MRFSLIILGIIVSVVTAFSHDIEMTYKDSYFHVQFDSNEKQELVQLFIKCNNAQVESRFINHNEEKISDTHYRYTAKIKVGAFPFNFQKGDKLTARLYLYNSISGESFYPAQARKWAKEFIFDREPYEPTLIAFQKEDNSKSVN